ncbi:MAG: hypothetical protein ACREDL_11095, partial [Bradyrhizobium sp.]
MEAEVAQIADNCFRLSLSDGAWRALGFNRRPRHGLMWRVVTPTWKAALEQRVHRELLVIFSAAHLTSFDATRDVLLSRLVDFYWGNGDLGRVFPSAEACLEAIKTYLGPSTVPWHQLLMDRLEIFAVPNSRLRNRLLVGCVNFSMNIKMIPLYVKSLGIRATSWPKPMDPEDAIRHAVAMLNGTGERAPDDRLDTQSDG